MKKFLIWTLALCLCCGAAFLGGCGGKKPSGENVIGGQTVETKLERTKLRGLQLGQYTLNRYINRELYQDAKQKYGEPEAGKEPLYEVFVSETYNPYQSEADVNAASAWHYMSLMSMTNRLAAIFADDRRYGPQMEEYNRDIIAEMAWYRGTDEITSYNSVDREWSVYGVHRAIMRRNTAAIVGDNAVYDDQMWYIREFLRAYERTGNERYLQEAEYLVAYCLDGWDSSINPDTGREYGGISWGQSYATKHTCSNAPIVSALCDLYEIYRDSNKRTLDIDGKTLIPKNEYYLKYAVKVYEYAYNRLRNADELYGDLVGAEHKYDPVTGLKVTTVQQGVDTTEYTYNTGSMISGGARLYQVTGESKYLRQAEISAEAAYEIFGKKDERTGLCMYPTTSTQWFNFVLLTGYIDLAKAQTDPADVAATEVFIDDYLAVLDYAYDHYLYNGLLPRDMVNGWLPYSRFDQHKDVMDAASAAESFAIVYEYYANKE